MPQEHHGNILYTNHVDMVEKLAGFLLAPENHGHLSKSLAHAMEKYAWESKFTEYDVALEDLAAMERTSIREKIER